MIVEHLLCGSEVRCLGYRCSVNTQVSSSHGPSLGMALIPNGHDAGAWKPDGGRKKERAWLGGSWISVHLRGKKWTVSKL